MSLPDVSSRASRNRWLWALVTTALFATGCERAPAEPTASDAGARPVPTAQPLTWTAPPTWDIERAADRGLYRAKYTVPKAGDAKLNSEVMVSRIDVEDNASLDKTMAGDLDPLIQALREVDREERLAELAEQV